MPDVAENMRSIVADPRETLDLELKQWIDPTAPEGIAKIARACIALRNNNGGHLLIGFCDDGTPDSTNVPADVRSTFQPDTIQAIVSKFSSEQFSVEVHFAERSGQEYPVIAVPPGVRTPVSAKSTLKAGSGKELIRDHAVYVRSLASNNTVSTSEPRRGDWERLTRIWFDNREADIGAFVRRHLSALDLNALGALLGNAGQAPTPPTMAQRLQEVLDFGRNHFHAAAAKRGFDTSTLGFRDVAIVIDGEIPPHEPNDAFLQKLFVAKPKHSGWSPFVDSTRAHERHDRPYFSDAGLESFVSFGGIDFWRMEPAGKFYHIRAMEEDVRGQKSEGGAIRIMALSNQVQWVTELLSIGLSFARSMGCPEQGTSVLFAFRWTKMAEREVGVWQHGVRWRSISDSPSGEDTILTTLSVPLETPQSGLAPHVETVIADLLLRFRGAELNQRYVLMAVGETLNRHY